MKEKLINEIDNHYLIEINDDVISPELSLLMKFENLIMYEKKVYSECGYEMSEIDIINQLDINLEENKFQFNNNFVDFLINN